jgi:GTP-binding protein Era
VREQALRLTKEEVPHALTAEVVEIEGQHVRVNLYTETESQKQILIGKRGAMVREIGTWARPGIEQLLGHAVFLELKVKASPKWRRNPTMLERMGL